METGSDNNLHIFVKVSDFSEVKLMETSPQRQRGRYKAGLRLLWSQTNGNVTYIPESEHAPGVVSDFSEVKLMETTKAQTVSNFEKSLRRLWSQTNGNTSSSS